MLILTLTIFVPVQIPLTLFEISLQLSSLFQLQRAASIQLTVQAFLQNYAAPSGLSSGSTGEKELGKRVGWFSGVKLIIPFIKTRGEQKRGSGVFYF